MNKIARDDTEHGVEYVRADEAEAEIESIQDGADADKVIIQYHEATIKRLQAEIDKLNSALHEWHNKTDWVQETAQPLELGMHRADVLRQRIERLKASIALDKKAENARELGLSYDDEPKIGCVNHDCDQCKAVQEPLHDEEVRLIAHNECPEDWDSLDNKECWLKGFVSGFKTAEREHKE